MDRLLKFAIGLSAVGLMLTIAILDDPGIDTFAKLFYAVTVIGAVGCWVGWLRLRKQEEQTRKAQRSAEARSRARARAAAGTKKW